MPSPRPTIAATLIALAGCSGGADDAAIVGKTDYPGSGLQSAEGRAVYERSCAECHDPGTGDAPAIGVREDWDDRSRLWVTVLAEHAKSGYLEMPAQAGASGLTDRDVSLASEYILSVTYPELPVD